MNREQRRVADIWLIRNVAELFKTPGKLRGKTPRTARKANPGEDRVVSLEAEVESWVY